MATSPNILLLMTDQQRFDTIAAAAGVSHLRTPNLDRLVHEGCLFTHAYTPNPICVPARHGLLTSQYGYRHGFMNNGGSFPFDDGLATFPRSLARRGYHTIGVGKMHYKPIGEHHGFAELHLMEERPRHLQNDAYARFLHEEQGHPLGSVHGVRPLIYHVPQRSPQSASEHGTFWLADRVNARLEANRDRPWLCFASWVHPHPPLAIPEAWQGYYDDVTFPEPLPYTRTPPYTGTSPDYYAGEHDTNEQRDALRRAYHTSIAMIDAAVGRILDQLEAQGQLDNTLILFTSDHGEMLGDLGHYHKGLPYEASVRVPLIARYPAWFAPGARDDRFVDLLDIFPTMLDAAGIEPEGNERELVGASLRPGAGGRQRDRQWVEHNRDGIRWIMARDHRYKYVFHYGGSEQVYDLEADPGEQHNLAAGNDPWPEAVADLKRWCFAMESAHGPHGPVDPANPPVQDDFEPWPRRGTKWESFPNIQFPLILPGDRTAQARAFLDELEAAILPGTDLAALLPMHDYWDEFARGFHKAYADGTNADALDELLAPVFARWRPASLP